MLHKPFGLAGVPSGRVMEVTLPLTSCQTACSRWLAIVLNQSLASCPVGTKEFHAFYWGVTYLYWRQRQHPLASGLAGSPNSVLRCKL